jgi:HEAT repeat protein
MKGVTRFNHNLHYRLLLGLGVVSFLFLFPPSVLLAQDVTATITQALEDLESEDSELRRGAVMLLGKYPRQPHVLDSLCGALVDPDTGVRRAAAVSIVEHIGSLSTVQARELLKAVTDPDKEVRLAVATWLPQVILRAMRRSPANRNLLILGEELAAIRDPVLAALSDSEPLVRRKAVEGLQYLMAPISAEELIPLFADSSPLVRRAAYPVLRNLLPGAAYAKAALAHYPDPDPAARLALAEAAAIQPSPDMSPLLERLLEDPDPAVQLLAATGIFLTFPGNGLPATLQTALEADDLDRSLVLRIIAAIRSMAPEFQQPVVEILLQSSRPSIRGQAVGLWLQSSDNPPASAVLSEFLRDPEPEVRQQVLRFIATRPQLVDPSLITGLPDNPYLDVRQRVLSLLRALDPEEQIRTLMKLLLDPDQNIRASALTRIAQMKPANWQAIFRASLRDPGARVRQTAATLLLRSMGPEGVELATAYARAHPDQEISRAIQDELSRLNTQ